MTSSCQRLEGTQYFGPLDENQSKWMATGVQRPRIHGAVNEERGGARDAFGVEDFGRQLESVWFSSSSTDHVRPAG
jgi:hypothetical protein